MVFEPGVDAARGQGSRRTAQGCPSRRPRAGTTMPSRRESRSGRTGADVPAPAYPRRDRAARRCPPALPSTRCRGRSPSRWHRTARTRRGRQPQRPADARHGTDRKSAAAQAAGPSRSSPYRAESPASRESSSSMTGKVDVYYEGTLQATIDADFGSDSFKAGAGCCSDRVPPAGLMIHIDGILVCAIRGRRAAQRALHSRPVNQASSVRRRLWRRRRWRRRRSW